jgi:hypothetical protein
MRTLLLFALALMPVFSQSGGHYNVVARDTMSPGGHGRITMNNEGQVVSALELDITGGPLNITRVVIHFDDPKLQPWSSPIAPRTDAKWTSRPIKWPSGKAHKVTGLDYWYSGKTGASPEIVVLGLQ